ncbi:hypothetical protein ELI_0668 [Eubacterium callanderi]|uniref:Uncharacterized protein n=1 Tax=Eubacterium callanderi TaxID=53442 RepID=E3GJ47_9FIRM|nr:hypothetical protein ELI_0668 [Eubacterium callanderi]
MPILLRIYEAKKDRHKNVPIFRLSKKPRDEAFYLRKEKRPAGSVLSPVSSSLTLALNLSSVRLFR